MKVKKEKEKYEKKLKKIDKKPKKFVDYIWVIKITITAFLISMLFSLITENAVPKIGTFVGILVVFLIIILGVVFDMIGVAVTACDIKSFNSMAAHRVKGSKTALNLIKNAEKVSAFCNDVVGDVCGIISGSVGIMIATVITNEYKLNQSIITLVITAIIAALTIGGKAMGKSYAINKSDVIVFHFAKFISVFKREKLGK